ncbi:MAG TPA: hypothetical protein VJ857_02380, partial [Methanocorpusculum sp.]|nr:hypothetical protein [Methanocorpusculum sp.]
NTKVPEIPAPLSISSEQARILASVPIIYADESGSEPEVSPDESESDDEEAHLYDVHAPIVSDEDRFGPPEPKPEPLFEVDTDKELSSFDLYADEPTPKTSSKKKQL